MYRYSRGQPGQGSLPRPAWGSGGGSHGARTASPEPGGLTGSAAGTPLGGGGTEPAKERLAGSSQDEVILQLENELLELRNACSWKDQRIAELSRTDTPAARLKRDIRHLASELHHTRKELSESVRELQEFRSQQERGEPGSATAAPRDTIDSPSATTASSGGAGGSNGAGAGRTGTQLRGRIVELEEENRSLRESVVTLKAQGLADSVQHQGQGHARQPSGASTQRAAEPQAPLPSSVNVAQSAASANTANAPGWSSGDARQQYMSQQQAGAALQAPSPSTVAPSTPSAGAPMPAQQAPPVQVQAAPAAQEEPLRQIVYSTANAEHAATIGPTMLQGVGTVDGVAMVAKVLLQRIHSSVCAAHRRAQPPMTGNLGPGGIPQQLMMSQMPMT